MEKVTQRTTEQNIAEVNKLIELVDEGNLELNEDTLKDIYNLINDSVKVRDGYFFKFAEYKGAKRAEVAGKWVDIVIGSTIANYILDEDSDSDQLIFANFHTFLAALTMLHDGLNSQSPEAHILPSYKKQITNLLDSAEQYGTNWSLFNLLSMANTKDIPSKIFSDSVKALSFEECVQQ